MVCHSQPYSPIEHALIAGCGGQWRKVNLILFNVYFDDSGTAPDQRIAIASALIIPAKRILAMEREWNAFRLKYRITDFHTSECIHRNQKSEFASWDEDKVKAVVSRVRQITTKYAVRAISYAVIKKDLDELLPIQSPWRSFAGNYHYTWAIRHALRLVWKWRESSGQEGPLEYIFDNLEKAPKADVDEAMAQEEIVRPGYCQGHYMFRKRQEWPALQCVDLLAWSCFSAARLIFENTPMHPLAVDTVRAYRTFRNKEWLTTAANTRETLEASFKKNLSSFPVLPNISSD
jgi:hypothetical protein